MFDRYKLCHKYTVTNSCDFVKKVSSCNIALQETMVSFDVVSLLTSILTILALQVTKNRLEADPTISERTNMSVNNIMNLLEFVLDNNITSSLMALSTKKFSAAQWVHL